MGIELRERGPAAILGGFLTAPAMPSLAARRSLTLLALLVGSTEPTYAAAAQTTPYTESLLARVRAAAEEIPGDRPQSLHYLKFAEFSSPQSHLLEGASDEPVVGAYTVFQVRFRRGWIMLDAGMDHEVGKNAVRFWQERYDRVQLALRDARLVLVTHEHWDHAAGAIRSPYLPQLAAKTMLTRAQLQTLEHPDGREAILTLDSTRAGSYQVFDYDLIHPIAPGVVLIKAPGHTPGSQMTYVRLASGTEVLFSGDVAWLIKGIEGRRQKPEARSRYLGEDRAAIQQQLDWLHELMTVDRIVIVPCHDLAWLNGLVSRGVLDDDLDLTNP